MWIRAFVTVQCNISAVECVKEKGMQIGEQFEIGVKPNILTSFLWQRPDWNIV
jgi:hypothetical protein